jgi:hypothetical protein
MFDDEDEDPRMNVFMKHLLRINAITPPQSEIQFVMARQAAHRKTRREEAEKAEKAEEGN